MKAAQKHELLYETVSIKTKGSYSEVLAKWIEYKTFIFTIVIANIHIHILGKKQTDFITIFDMLINKVVSTLTYISLDSVKVSLTCGIKFFFTSLLVFNHTKYGNKFSFINVPSNLASNKKKFPNIIHLIIENFL